MFSVCFLLFILINVGYPFIGTYIPELLMVNEAVIANDLFYLFFFLISIFFSTIGMFFAISRLLYRTWHDDESRKVIDLSMFQLYIIAYLFILCVFFGVAPNFYIEFIWDSLDIAYNFINGV